MLLVRSPIAKIGIPEKTITGPKTTDTAKEEGRLKTDVGGGTEKMKKMGRRFGRKMAKTMGGMKKGLLKEKVADAKASGNTSTTKVTSSTGGATTTSTSSSGEKARAGASDAIARGKAMVEKARGMADTARERGQSIAEGARARASEMASKMSSFKRPEMPKMPAMPKMPEMPKAPNLVGIAEKLKSRMKSKMGQKSVL